MNITAVVVSQLKKRRAALAAKHAAELAPIDAALAAFGGVAPSAPAPAKRRKKRHLTPEQIAKMQAGRADARAAKAAAGGANGEATTPPAKRESRPRLPQGPKTASLAAAAE